MSDDILARLREMAAGAAAVEPKKSAAKAKEPAAVPVAAVPEPVVVKPVAATVAKAESGVTTPVVVLDDATTFSNLSGAKVCYVDPTAEEIDTAAYANGISIADLLALRDAVALILKIVG
jgi:hypothetical protein